MQVKRFVATDMRRALELVRQELGSEAVILSSRRVEKGVEILTSVAEEPLAAPAPVSAKANTPSSSELFAGAAEHKAGKSARDIATEIEIASRKLAATHLAEESADEFLRTDQVVNAGIKRRPQAAASTPTARPNLRTQSAAERYGLLTSEPVAPAAPQAERTSDIGQLQEELAEMRLLLEQQLSRLGSAPNGPDRPPLGPQAQASTLALRMQQMGFSEAVATAALKKPLRSRLPSKAWPEAMARLAHAIPVADKDITARGGVFAFVGATGAGKTTTVAKLAARYVMAHGADKVALVTTDTCRLAAHSQLHSLGSILQVPVRVVDKNNPLPSVLRSLRRCELVLIDTAGLRHGDPALKQQMTELAAIPKVNSYLVMSSNAQAQMLKASIHAYRDASVKGCVLTKLDETASLGEAISTAMQARLPIAYTTHGQDIPADIDVASGARLIARANHLRAQNNTERKTARLHSADGRDS